MLPGRLARAVRSGIDIVRSALARFFEERAPESAAGMAFYAIMSLFPVLLLLFTVGRFVLETFGLTDDALALVLSVFPLPFADLVEHHLLEALTARGTVAGALGLLLLAWSASSGFAALIVNLNRAWSDARPLGAVIARLRAFAVVGCLLGFLAVVLLGRATIRFVAVWGSALVGRLGLEPLVSFHPGVIVFVIVAATFFLLYRLVPTRKVHVLSATLGAVFSASASMIVTSAFGLYLRSGFATYKLIYGSLGALISFLVWVYAMALIVLFGGHLAAAFARHRGL